LRRQSTAKVSGTNAEISANEISAAPEWRDELFGKTAAFSGKSYLAYPNINFPPADQPFSWAVWVKPEGDGSILSKIDNQSALRGVDLLMYPDGKIAVHVIDAWPDDALKVVSKDALAKGKWMHVAATYDGSKKANGLALYFNGKKQELVVETDKLTGTFATQQPFRVGMRSTDSPLHASLADVRLFQRALTDSEIDLLVQDSVRNLMKDVQYEKIAEGLRPQFDEFLLAYSRAPVVVKATEVKAQLDEQQAAKAKFDAALPTTMVMEERTEPRETFVLQRGRYDMPDEQQKVSPDVPDVLPPFPADAPHNRLGLARWITSRDNPLTSRVVVNRLWQRLFGLGLAKNSDNLGIQSEPPSHPELLDWLAVELIDSGWDLQHIQRLILFSNTYQQRSEADPALYQRDPENRLLARGPRHRLSAEAVRDNALAVSGLLVPKIGGRSVMPYQPEGLWEELAGGAFEVYTQGHGDDLYRRSLYVYRKRTVPHPSMATFDAPSWEICQVKRATTNTPLQALALLNDVVYVEAARKFAERMMSEGGSTIDSRLTFAFRLATGRLPTDSEIGLLRGSFERKVARFRQTPFDADSLLSHGEATRDVSLDPVELAAYAAIASVLLNTDEAMSKN
jgi:hypothetical protein